MLTWVGSHWQILLILTVDALIVAYLWADLSDVVGPFDDWDDAPTVDPSAGPLNEALAEIRSLPETAEPRMIA